MQTTMFSVLKELTSLGTFACKRSRNISRKNLSFLERLDFLPSANSVKTRIHLLPVRPKSCDSANCMRPLRRWACLKLNLPDSTTLQISSQSSALLAAVLHIKALPVDATLKSKRTQSAEHCKSKGCALSPSSAKIHPSSLNRADTDFSVLPTSFGRLKAM